MNRKKLEEIVSNMNVSGDFSDLQILRAFQSILEDEPVKEEIMPKAGELWQLVEKHNLGPLPGKWFVHHGDERQKPEIIHDHGSGSADIPLEMIHGQNGWKRVYPPVKE